MSKIKDTLATKLMVSILLMAIPIFLISMGLVFVQSQKAIHKEAQERAVSTLNTTMQRLRNHMTIVETAANSNTWYAVEHFEPDSLLALTNRIVRLNRHVDGCSITAEPDMFPAIGRFSAYTVQEGDSAITKREADYDYYSKEWYRAAATSGKACWIDPFDDYTEGSLFNSEIIASYNKPLYRDGKMIGVISADLSLNSLDKTINTAEPPYPGAFFLLMGSDGKFFINPHENKSLTAMAHEISQGKDGNTHVEMDGELYHVCYCPVTGTDWKLALVCPDREILKNYNHLFLFITALTIIGLVVILWFCRRGVNQAITPLKELLDTSQKLSEGNYNLTIPKTDREDVIGTLQNSFATMQESLNKHVADIRQTAADTKKSNLELAYTTKLAKEAVRQKDIFIQNVSHQIRTPLNIIMGFAQVLRETIAASGGKATRDALGEEEKKSITDMMSRNAKHLRRMLFMLFDSSEIGLSEEISALKQDHIPCNAVAKMSIDDTTRYFPELDIRFKTNAPDDLCVQTSRLYLKRSLREILYNAAKYSDGQHVLMEVEREGDMVRFIVEDTGKGITEADRENIFKFFTKVDDLSEGLGLGLPLAKRHAQMLNGDLRLDADYQEGCRFILELPLA